MKSTIKAFFATALFALPLFAADKTRPDAAGQPIAIPTPIDPALTNPWTPDLEAGFQQRMRHVMNQTMAMKVGVNTYFENEKRGYGHLMMQVMGGRQEALKHLQAEDAQAKEWHKHTLGIDWYACFTIKHQIRKYFYFGDLLDPAYRQRMFDAAKIWTEQDPLRRPHHAFKQAGPGWGPDAKNSWVDVRSTDNLWWMRVMAVYLMAEETGNEATRQKYAGLIRMHVSGLYRIGMGEWDSENYLGHSITPVLCLYDFAKDPRVKAQAKAALDWMTASAAVKYWRGGYNGPTRRDYNHPYPLGGSAAAASWGYFGDYPGEPHEFESDEVHAWTSSYRPPLAVVALARKNFDRPAELFASKPPYSATLSGRHDVEPADLETTYFGHSFQFGTLAFGSGRADINGFKAILWNTEKGMDTFVAAPTTNPKNIGSPKYEPGMVEPNRVAQYRNIAIWLARQGDAPWRFVLPKTLAPETQNGVTFFKAEKTWIALHPVNLSSPAVDAAETEKVNLVAERDGNKKPFWPDHHVLSAAGQGGSYCGFAIEFGEAETHGTYEQFKNKVLASAKLDASAANSGTVEYTSATGTKVKMTFADDLANYKVWRNGQFHDWKQHAAIAWQQVGAAPGAGLIHQQWRGDGTLRVQAGGHRFTCTVTPEGKVSFSNRTAK